MPWFRLCDAGSGNKALFDVASSLEELRFIITALLMGRGVRSLARRMQAPDSFSHRKRCSVLGTTGSTILCGQVIRSTRDYTVRASASPSAVVHIYHRYVLHEELGLQLEKTEYPYSVDTAQYVMACHAHTQSAPSSRDD